MLAKTVVVSLMGFAAITEAATLHRPFDQIMQRRSAKALKSRQFGGGFNGGNNFGNGGNNGGNNNNNNGGNNGGNNNDQNNDNANDNNNGGNNNNNGGNQCLEQDVIATGSAQDGTAESDDPAEAASLTDDANFINFCSGQTITNGLQNEDGSCNPIPMGQIPSTNNMISGILTNPAHNDDVEENQDFDITVQYTNLDAGTFTNPDNTYYSAPQQINGNGQIIGHTHVTVQDLGNSLTPNTPPDPSQFVFFKGINDAGNGQGLLSATVTGGLPAGNYRVCTMVSSSNHQPVLMPVAQRGAQDDCNKFTVGANGGNNNNNNGGNNNNNNGGNNNNNNNGGNNNNNGNGNNGNNNNNGGNGGNGFGNGGFGNGFNGGNGFGNGGGFGGNGGNQQGANQGSNTQALGGAAPEISNTNDSRRPFAVDGNTFATEDAAKQRSCDIQNTACSDAANAGAGHTLADCQTQQQACLSS